MLFTPFVKLNALPLISSFYEAFTQSRMCFHFRQLQDHERVKNSEVEELLTRVSALEAERKTLQLDKTNLNTNIKHVETELQLSQQANRCAHMNTHTEDTFNGQISVFCFCFSHSLPGVYLSE